MSRPRSLRTRLVAGVLGIVLIMAAVIGAISTLSLRNGLIERLDSQVRAAANRVEFRRHGDVPEQTLEVVPNEDEADNGTRSTPPDHHDHSVPKGLDAVGQRAGTLTAVIAGEQAGGSTPATSRAITAGYIRDDGTYRALSAAEVSSLLDLKDTGKPVSVRIDSLGVYRVLVEHDSRTGDKVITGLSMEEDNDLVRGQILFLGLIALAGAAIAAFSGRALVRSSLAPLERVACTAQRVASLPLDRGEVSIDERVDDADLATSQEVSQVGGALNTLLGHVDSALAARQRSETQVRQFVADASHELRTPLASIRGYTELIRRGSGEREHPGGTGTPGDASQAAGPLGLSEEASYALDRVHSESLRMTALVEDLLLLARLDSGRPVAREEVDLVGILVDAVADARAAGPDHEWSLDLAILNPPEGMSEDEAEDFEPTPAIVEGEEARLRQVIVNLLANARVHTPAGTRVTTTLERDGKRLVIRVADNGPGIEESMRDRIFVRFARGDASRERSTGSTGLGMSIALAIVASHGGALTVETSTEEADHGTVFTVELPAADVE
ncbi:sensor histidine kinase [Actinomyces sp. zg296]|uniref:sensor histidine kinase n=1 Tax=Actinomyces sp. zg296 TaxID=2609289 RepID=UPI0019158721|nr:HAMP domain-containing sensor histidine kinase [Actinomyces sp. zg296]